MRVNTPVTDTEVAFKDGETITSETNLKGILVRVNRYFKEISGFTDEDLIKKNHNIVRHPDMPEAAFQDLWDKVKAGEPWVGMVKNRCKNGDFYWVEANVTPIFNNGTPTGYLSVRRKPSRQQVREAEALYAAINNGSATLGAKSRVPGLDAWRNTTLMTRLMAQVAGLLVSIAAMGYVGLAAGDAAPLKTVFFTGLSGSVIFSLGLLRWFSARVLKPLAECSDHLRALAEAKYDGQIDINRADEIGNLMRRLKCMQVKIGNDVESAKANQEEMSRIRFALDSVQANVMMADENGVIIYCNDTVLQMFQDAESDIRNVLPSFSAADLIGSNIDIFHKNPAHQRGMLDSLNTSVETQIEVSNRTFKFVANPVFSVDKRRLGTVVEWTDRTQELAAERDVQAVVASVLQGDLTRRISMDGKTGFFETISTGVNGIVEKLSGAMIEIRQSSSAVHSGSTEIAQGNANLSQRTEEQAASLEETASSMAEMTHTVRKNAEDAAEASTLAADARDKAELGGKVVGEAITAMEEINQSSKKISDIISAIDEIAFQTNLLALNASVEAARAGEQGRGFAVVASEVRNLAGRSANAAKEIKDLIETSVEAVEKGSQLVNASGETLTEIVEGVRQVTEIVTKISAASQQQSAGVDEISTAVSQMDEMTQQNAALVEEIAAASENMRKQADALNEVVSAYNVDAETREDQRFDHSQAPPTGAERRGGDRPWADSSGTAAASQAAPPAAAAGGNWKEF